MEPLSYFHMNWCNDKNGTLYSEPIACYMHNIRYERHRPFSKLLNELKELPEKDTSLSEICNLYRTHNFTPNVVKIRKEKEGTKRNDNDVYIEPILTMPNLSYCSNYHILSLRMNDLEYCIRQYREPGFSIDEVMNNFCKYYQLDLESTFPSLYHDISNYEPQRLKRRHPMQKKEEKIMDDNKVPCIYDNQALYNQLERYNQERDNEKQDNEMCGRKKQKISETQSKKVIAPKNEGKNYGRLLPVSFLPIFLNRLPLFYQSLNNTCTQAYNLRDCLLKNTPLTHYPDYLYQQIEVLSYNCEYISHIHQQNYCRTLYKEQETNKEQKTGKEQETNKEQKGGKEQICSDELTSLRQLHKEEIGRLHYCIDDLKKIIDTLLIKIEEKTV